MGGRLDHGGGLVPRQVAGGFRGIRQGAEQVMRWLRFGKGKRKALNEGEVEGEVEGEGKES
jgi:hypothetical protein